eukprot:365758-Chlamydomonas_euryale.AAC.1
MRVSRPGCYVHPQEGPTHLPSMNAPAACTTQPSSSLQAEPCWTYAQTQCPAGQPHTPVCSHNKAPKSSHTTHLQAKESRHDIAGHAHRPGARPANPRLAARHRRGAQAKPLAGLGQTIAIRVGRPDARALAVERLRIRRALLSLSGSDAHAYMHVSIWLASARPFCMRVAMGGAQLLGTAFGTKSAEELPNGARSEWLPGKAAEIFGRAWDVRFSAGTASVAY